MSILEAMARGRGVVATGVGSVGDLVIHGETGLLVSPGNIDELANALSQMKDIAFAASLGKGAHKLAKSRYSEAAVIDQLGRLYQGLSNG